MFLPHEPPLMLPYECRTYDDINKYLCIRIICIS